MSQKLKVLIVENDARLGNLWQQHLERCGNEVFREQTQEGAKEILRSAIFDVVILNLLLRGTSAFAISDIARKFQPQTPVIFVTNTSFFSDGSIFGLCPNARAFMQADAPPDDIVAMVEHYGRAA